MKNLLYPLFIFLFLPGDAQDIEVFKNRLVKDHRSYKSVTQALEDIRPRVKINIKKDRVSFFELRYREITFEYQPKEKYPRQYHISLFERNDSVFYLELEEAKESKRSYDYRSLIRFADSVFAKKLISAYNEYYKSDRDWDYVYAETEHDYYGIEWGLRFSLEPAVYTPMRKVFEMVANDDTASIRDLCNHSCLESKAYGVTAVYLLKKEGYPVSNELAEKFDLVKNSGIEITFAPGGCMVFSRTSIAEALSDDFLKRVYSRYLDWKK